MKANDWCRILGITPPVLEAVAGHREANTYSRMIVALLEKGEPMTLEEVAARFETAGIAPRARAMLSLQRCKPARPPIYREADRYHLDPHDEELDLWAFRLGLRPPKVVAPPPKAPEPKPLPGPEVPLTSEELDEAWRRTSLYSWSAQRVALCVLDAAGGPLTPREVVAAVAARTEWHSVSEHSEYFGTTASKIDVLPDGRWAIRSDSRAALHQARAAVRALIEKARRSGVTRTDPEELRALQEKLDKERVAHGERLAQMSRALLVAFPPARPEAVALLDVTERRITTFVGQEELAALHSRLAGYEIIGAVDVRGLLSALGFEPGDRRLAELGPPQKTKALGPRRTLKVTLGLLVQGSCGIVRPFGEEGALARYLAKGELQKLRRRLEMDVRSLYALYEYGRVHGAVRLRWGPVDERVPVPWVHRDEPRLYGLQRSALAKGVALQVVVGNAPELEDPWARAQLAFVAQGERSWDTWLVDEGGYEIYEPEIQRARLDVEVH